KDWLGVVLGIGGVLLVILVISYWKAGGGAVTPFTRVAAGTLKLIAIALLAACLLEPMTSHTRARPGANKFAILADNSQSMMLKDKGEKQTRGEALKSLAGADARWVAAIGHDFDVRQFSFDSQLHATDSFAALQFDGRTSNLGAALQQTVRRYQGQPLAGILLFTDGSATDREAVEKVLADATGAGAAYKLPPVYPVLMGASPAADVSVDSLTVSQTNFEDAPVTIAAQIMTSGSQGRMVVAELLDESGKSVDKQQARVLKDGDPLLVRFKVKPEQHGISFYKVRAAAEGDFTPFDHPEKSGEATLANNSRLAVVDRGQGPFKLLYVTGRMNWEFKFLQRSVSDDDQLELTGMIRVANKEPKFVFLSRDSANPLFKGFDPRAAETAEQFDQPVLQVVTHGGNDITPRGKFPGTAEELDAYHAVIIDHLESGFFTPEQMLLLKDFVGQRGGGLLMLGGEESFKNGKYDRTPIGDVLPVYCDEVPAFPEDASFRMALTREGWLEPWMRLRPEESAEQQRIAGMPAFTVMNSIRGIKPGATVLARAMSDKGAAVPALVEQRFGRGRAAALLIGDLWKWDLGRPAPGQSDMQKAWRQMIRWMVSDVPKRIEAAVTASNDGEDAAGTMRIAVQVRSEVYAPLDNATVMVKVTLPDKKAVQLRAEASLGKPGEYATAYIPREPGAYRAEITVTGADGAEIGQTAAGWTSDPAAEEFRVLAPDRALLERIASATGGQVIAANALGSFAASLPTRHAQITEPYVEPLWHQPWVFLGAIVLLGAEWALRRWRGLA
ncbi:MAG TPA: glutamine amidotransferase, partial [Phycisphaerae bacterium]|nr:glutamine amidotransferase [Phycisphaerae bacterium]